MSLRSCNTEFEELLFGQASRVAECCTNRLPENVLQNMFIRLQVILAQGKVTVESKVTRAAKGYHSTKVLSSPRRSCQQGCVVGKLTYSEPQLSYLGERSVVDKNERILLLFRW